MSLNLEKGSVMIKFCAFSQIFENGLNKGKVKSFFESPRPLNPEIFLRRSNLFVYNKLEMGLERNTDRADFNFFEFCLVLHDNNSALILSNLNKEDES